MIHRHREETIHTLARFGVNLATAQGLLRCGTTLHRLAEADCNGDWPYAKGGGELCPKCSHGYFHASTIKRNGCPHCSAVKAAETLCPEGWRLEVQGDPRGRVLYLVTPDGTEITVG
jgi:hypothetical protein